MKYKFTTIEECQQIINEVSILLNTAHEKIYSIQFPFEENNFNHISCNRTNRSIESAIEWLSEMQKDLNTYKKGKR